MNPNKLIIEEKKAIVLFMWMFYIVFFSYEYLDYFILAKPAGRKIGIPEGGLSYWYYLIIALFLPIGVFLLKKGNPYIIKYFYFLSFTIIDFLNEILIYIGNGHTFRSGNVIEVFFVLFSPLFVNRKYFFAVSIGMIIKYTSIGLILSQSSVILPIVLLIIFSLISLLLLIRFNSYIEAIKSIFEELRQKEKLALIGQMAAAIGHEIRNPLASLKGFTQLQHERYPDTNEFYPIMIQEVDRINSIVNDLMYLGKPKVIQFEKENIEEIIAYTLSITQQQAGKQGVNIETLMEGPLPQIECDDKQLKQVFINLIKNAVEAMPDGGKIKINVKVYQEKRVIISIQDQGCGIKEEDIMNLGEPFYTTKKDGTGLGLMVTNQIITDHGGQLKFHSNVDIGTKVEVVLPVTQIINQNSRLAI